MRDLITADLHLSENPRDEYRFQFLEQRLPKLLRHYDVTCLYLLGDLTETKNYHSSALVNRIIDGLIHLHEQCPRIVVLRGNHDYDADPEHPFFGFTGYLEGFHYINAPTRMGTDLLLPHSRNPSEDWKSLDLRGISMILTHATFTGAMGGNRIALTGCAPPSTNIAIVSGDVHIPQYGGNVTYVGAPYTIDFGDDYQPRVLLRANGKLTSIKLKGPQKRVLYISGDRRHGDANPGDIVRIKVKLERKDYDRWADIRERMRQQAVDQGYIVESVLPVIEASEITANVQHSRGLLSDPQLLAEYCDKFQIEEPLAKQGKALL